MEKNNQEYITMISEIEEKEEVTSSRPTRRKNRFFD